MRISRSGLRYILWLGLMSAMTALCYAVDAPNDAVILDSGADVFFSRNNSGTASVGDTYVIRALANGTQPFTYQWSFAGTPIAGATDATYSIAVTAGAAGLYGVTITNSAGSSSASGILHVRGPAPTIVQQPVFSSTNLNVGDTLTITAVVTGGSNYWYSWSADEDHFISGLDPTANTTLTYTKSGVTASDAKQYRLRVYVEDPISELATSSQTYVAVLTNPAVITQQPVSMSAAAGSLATFSVAATGTNPLTYTWYKDGVRFRDLLINPGPGQVDGGTYLTLRVVPAYAGDYVVKVGNVAGGATSNVATLTVTPDVIITAQPASQSVATGSAVTFNVVADKAPGVSATTISYQWRKNGTDIAGATGTAFSLANAQASDAAAYTVTVTGTYNLPVTSAAATLSVGNAIPSTPAITSQPVDQIAAAGGTATFTVTASGLAPFSYQWSHNSSPISGATSASLVLTNVQASDGGNYSVVVSNGHGSAQSNVVSLSIQGGNGGGEGAASVPAISQQPAGQTVLGGHDGSFSVVASGSPSPTYQWYFNDQPISGATGSTYTVTNAQSGNAGSYYVVATNSAGSATSAVAALAVVQSNFQGVYDGKLGSGGTGGDFALYVRSDGTGVMIVHFSASDTALLLDNISLGGDGAFSAGGTTLAHDRMEAVKDANGQPPASGITARDATNVSGTISLSGGLSGSIGGLTFFTQRSAGGSTYAGFYKAPAVNGGSGDAYAIVDGDGHALVFAQTGTRATVGTGAVDNSGQLNVSVADGGLMAAKLDPSNGGLSATVDKGAFAGLAFIGIRDNVTHTDRLANISTRGRTGVGDQVLIAGFIISGNTPRQVLVRAVGPALTDFGVTGTLGNPRFEIYRGNTKIAESNDWGSESDADQVAAKSPTVGAFALPRTGKDAALLVTLDPGAYTAVVSGVADTTGVTLVEVYDAGDMQAGTPKLYNISSRGYVGTDDQILIAGIIVGGNAPKKLLVRAVGPTLGTLGLAGSLSDPVLTIYNGSTVISQNDDWGGDPAHAALSKSLGAFDLPANSKDASLLITLAPGVYTAQVTGKNGAQGIALVEVYDAGD